jgi:putative tryptophan/tyrosine transport system substrate-binding protein
VGARVADLSTRTALFVDPILKGARPSELPIEQPTIIELINNLKTAKILGPALPPTLLAQFNEMID